MAKDEQPDRVSRQSSDQVPRLRRFAEQTANCWPDSVAAGDPTADLYDDEGLPVTTVHWPAVLAHSSPG